jgi:hypothetical protein
VQGVAPGDVHVGPESGLVVDEVEVPPLGPRRLALEDLAGLAVEALLGKRFQQRGDAVGHEFQDHVEIEGEPRLAVRIEATDPVTKYAAPQASKREVNARISSGAGTQEDSPDFVAHALPVPLGVLPPKPGGLEFQRLAVERRGHLELALVCHRAEDLHPLPRHGMRLLPPAHIDRTTSVRHRDRT